MRAFSTVFRLSMMCLLAGSGATAWAADPGAIQQVSGNVTITSPDNVTRKAAAREKVMVGDTITTDAKSETLIKLADDSTIALRPNTQFQLTEYKYEKANTDSTAVKLLRGTARMITGLIAKRVPANYRVSTPTATIGVRGTDFDVAVLPDDTADARAGVYDYVRDGATNIQLTQSGQALDVKKNQTAFAPDKLKPGEEPLQILRETPIFLQQGGGLDAIIQSITIQIPMFR
jgi:hypothetical protein